MCHSDVHLIDGDWGAEAAKFPLVAGHEIVGIVTAVGSDVTTHVVGQHVGVGWQRSACGVCQYCLAGQVLCHLRQMSFDRSELIVATDVGGPEQALFVA